MKPFGLEAELMAKLERSRKHVDEGIYKEADNMVAGNLLDDFEETKRE